MLSQDGRRASRTEQRTSESDEARVGPAGNGSRFGCHPPRCQGIAGDNRCLTVWVEGSVQAVGSHVWSHGIDVGRARGHTIRIDQLSMLRSRKLGRIRA